MTAISLRAAPRFDVRAARPFALALLAIAAVILYLVFQNTSVLPHDEEAPLFRTINDIRDWVRDNRSTNEVLIVIGSIRGPIGALAEGIIGLLQYVGWLGIIGVAAALGYVAGGLRIAALAIVGFLALGVLGLWPESVDTLGLTVAAVVLSLAIGVPLGILTARNQRVQSVLSPILDVMQIMPTFAYLAPMALLFQIGEAPSTIATLIYAMPAAIRITALGIRRVPATTVEAAESLGATNMQVLRKVQLPLARRVIGLAVNQTIMLALGMVVITALIDAPGLGIPITRALFGNNVGAAFDAGIAVVILAIVLDRLTEAASVRMDPRSGIATQGPSVEAQPRDVRAIRRSGPLGLASAAIGAGAPAFARGDRARLARRLAPLVAAAAAIAVSLQIDPNFPDVVKFSLRNPVNAVTDWIKVNAFALTDAIKNGFTDLVINPLQGVLVSAPWWLVVAVVFGLALLVSGRRAAVSAAVCLILIAALQIWQHSMETLTTVLVAIGVTLAVGLALGIMAARSARFSTVLRPILDFAQTMPSLVYLLPAVALFSASRLTAILAAVIYAAPPVIRLVEAGIRSVPDTLIEAGTASGATELQLLRKVRLPVSAPALLLAANQGIVMVLAMVVLGGLVGAGGLGYDVIAGFSQLEDFGKGFAAGVAIVLLGIMLDRITQGAGSRRPRIQRAAG
jgi:glycine betaine/proline transport system permease protein